MHPSKKQLVYQIKYHIPRLIIFPFLYSKEDSHWDYLTDIHACSALISSRHLIPVQYLVHLLCLLDNWNGSKESLNLAIHSYLELLNNGYHAPNDIGKKKASKNLGLIHICFLE